MNPIKLSQQLQETLVSYLTTTFDVNRDRKEPALEKFIKDSFNRPRALFAGPYLELTPPYQTAESLEQLAQAGVISPRLLRMDCFRQGRPLPINAPLYTHQAQALRKLCAENRNIVVSSGTGSGKTECFLLPILNDLLIDPAPGVRAVLIYPLNALVNDQLDRLRVLLRNSPITFGRYTSELETKADRAAKQMAKEWQEMEPARRALFDQYPLPNEIIGRDQIREEDRLPQILITNYAMLEYLLLRPQDSPLFNQGKWRFVVLDEAHSYAGAQGIEVGMLMRRLKHRLGHQPGQMRCIATSATLTTDDKKDASQFAEALFGERFTTDDIIFGQANHDYVPHSEPRKPAADVYAHPRFDELIQTIRQEQGVSTDDVALLMQEIGLITEDELSLAESRSPSQFLWELLSGNEDLTNLRRIMTERGQPVEVTSVAENLFHNRLPVAQQPEALYRLIELAAMARPNVDEASLLPARYHLFVRPPQGIWACLNPQCPHRNGDTAWSKLFATPRETCDACSLPVYPIVVCRTCGQVYVRLQQVGNRFVPEAALEEEPRKRYVTWRPIHDNRALADGDEDEDNLVEQAGERVLKQTEMKLCLNCQREVKANGCDCGRQSAHAITLYLLQTESPVTKGKSKGTKDEPVELMQECGRCHSLSLKGTEIATDITLNALTPLAVLTEDLYRALPPSTQLDLQAKPGEGRKLLSFYDSRQGAARFAAFVQDIVNQQAYRRIIREAVKDTSTATFLPDLEKVSERCLDLALRYRVAHNDPTIPDTDLPRHSQYLNQNQQQRLIRYMRKQIFAEITTQLRSRQSLEALGLLSVQYFEPDKLLDFTPLAQKLRLSPQETRTLVEYLLDDLRRNKVVVLPEGVKRDDPIFGRNKFSPRLVRSGSGQYEIAWIGETPRHRRRQLIQKILGSKGLTNDDTTIIQALNDILEWLIDKSGVLDTSRPADGYQIRQEHLFFQAHTPWYRCDQCQRLSSRGNFLPCPQPYCQGRLQPLADNDPAAESFYYNNLHQTMVPMRIEEHTAQLDPDKGRAYQNQFKSGDINMLSCSTTFEMGIDLGDLQAVIMSNIPPTVANYKQRAGRAGRRTSGTAFILAWASNRPHDQTYFKSPAEIIGGHVRVPFLDVQNNVITQRHINALLLSEFLRYCAAQSHFNDTAGLFFDEQTPGGASYALLPDWLDANKDILLTSLTLYIKMVNQAATPPIALHNFAQDMRSKGYEHYQKDAGYYKSARLELGQKQLALMMQGAAQREIESLQGEIKRLGQQLDRLQNEDIINYLSDRGVLPSYSFPLHTVELRIPPHLLANKQLRLQRNLREAIREYAPGQEVVADKRIWKSEGLNLLGKEPKVFAYHICPTCNYLRLEETPGKNLEDLDQPCSVCQTPPKRGRWPQQQYIEPDGFRASEDSGQPAGQYVDRPFNRMRSALVPRPVNTNPIGTVLATGYDRAGALLYVNEGFQGTGFRICPKCGKQVHKGSAQCNGTLNGLPCPGWPQRDANSALGFMQNTDTLYIKFSSTTHILLPPPQDQPFWLSLQYALLQGASRALQLERKDIDGVLFPESDGFNWRPTIVLYDNVPGGAGYVKRIEEEIEKVVAAALETVACNCEKSCYRCLREYSNQWEHHLLERSRITEFLKALDADLQNHKHQPLGDAHSVAAVNQIAWLWEQIKQTHSNLILAAEKVSLSEPTTDGISWLDLLQQLLHRNVKVQLCLNQLPETNSGDGEAIASATHLRLLLRKGLTLRQTPRSFPWVAIIDPETAGALAVSSFDSSSNIAIFSLHSQFNGQLCMTNKAETVREAWELMDGYGRAVESADLREPADTRIYEVIPDDRPHTETEFFAAFYAKPVRRMVITDRYMDRRETILGRLGNHIALAQQQGQLERVIVNTREGSQEQKVAIQQLKSKFLQLNISFKFDYHMAHDRSIELLRSDESQARVILGVGLDFIEPDGIVRHTFLVFQDPFV